MWTSVYWVKLWLLCSYVDFSVLDKTVAVI